MCSERKGTYVKEGIQRWLECSAYSRETQVMLVTEWSTLETAKLHDSVGPSPTASCPFPRARGIPTPVLMTFSEAASWILAPGLSPAGLLLWLWPRQTSSRHWYGSHWLLRDYSATFSQQHLLQRAHPECCPAVSNSAPSQQLKTPWRGPTQDMEVSSSCDSVGPQV